VGGRGGGGSRSRFEVSFRDFSEKKKKLPQNTRQKKQTEPSVAPLDQLPPIKFTKPDVEGIIQFLVREKDFDEGRIRGALNRLGAAGAKAQQGRLDSFFKPVAPSVDVRKLGSGGGAAGTKRGAAAGGAGGGGEKKKMKGKAGGIGRK
jgi:flap endonuclease-1